MNTEALAQLANVGVASATVVLALAWLTHLVEWAAAREVRPARLDSDASLVSAGGHSAGGSSPATGVAAEGETSPSPSRPDRFGQAGLSLTVLGTALLAAGVLARALAAGRVPWGNMYEFAVTGALVVLVVYLGLVLRAGIQWLAPIVTGFAVVVLGLAILVYVPAGPLVPALDSYWLVLHVSAAAIAGGAFVVGAGTSALFLLKQRAEQRAGAPVTTGPLGRLPTTEQMDRLAFQVHAFAFPLWTFAALIAGPIWAQNAWGRYWGWDPKEVWAFITWVVYAGYLHARATAGWRGRGAAVLALVGFATFLFNFVGINLFVSGLHSYAF
ncbi:MAG: c-type cytochrome biogenesis protein CcsB [Nocardioidaceae bacterium]|nr:c-type cytochrome biogenesis protein CcsB [Nocardioidaceae bacterium]